MCVKIFRHWAISSISKHPWAITSELLGNCPMPPSPGYATACVYELSLFDEHPFEHEFFIRIQRSFRFMQRLSIITGKAQKDRQCRKLKNTDQDLLISY
jgi:hypothetical protein